MKKKPHRRPSTIKQVFSEFRSRLYRPKAGTGDAQYEVQQTPEGYRVVIHRERGADQTLHFSSRQELDAYLKSLG